MAVLKVKDSAGNWLDITGTGTRGEPGGPVPVGGTVNQKIAKTSDVDFEVEWRDSPRIALSVIVAQYTSHATANTMARAVGGDATIYPDRMYWIVSGWRCIQDPGAVAATCNAQTAIGTVNLQGFDVVNTHDTGLWGAHSQTWVRPGSDFTATVATLDCRLNLQLSVASKIFYDPRIYILEI